MSVLKTDISAMLMLRVTIPKVLTTAPVTKGIMEMATIALILKNVE